MVFIEIEVSAIDSCRQVQNGSGIGGEEPIDHVGVRYEDVPTVLGKP